MTFIFKTILLSFFLFGNTFSQFYEEDEISPYIIEFMEIANELAKSFDGYKNKDLKMKFTNDEIEHIAELFFKAYNEDPVGFSYYIRKEFYEWGAKVKESGKVTEPKPAMKRKLLKDQISKKYGIVFTEIIGTPAFLRGKFIAVNRSSYFNPDTKSNYSQLDFNFLIEDILKGDKFFNIGDTMIVSSISNVEPNFEGNMSYLIPIKPRIGLTEYKGEVTFNYLHEYYDRLAMSVPTKVFPIENEIITNCEYFGIKDTNWVEFKKYFRETFLIFN